MNDYDLINCEAIKSKSSKVDLIISNGKETYGVR